MKNKFTLFQYATVLIVSLISLGLLTGAKDQISHEANAPLLPLSGLFRKVSQLKKHPSAIDAGCSTIKIPEQLKNLNFGPGEELRYAISVLNIPTGSLILSMQKRQKIDGKSVFPLFATASTHSIFSLFGEIDSKMFSYIRPEDLTPVRAMSRVHIKKMFKDAYHVREDAVFTKFGESLSLYQLERHNKHHEWSIRRQGSSKVMTDLLSVVYWSRSRKLPKGTPFCFELFHRSRLWRIKGKSIGRKMFASDIGDIMANELELEVSKITKNINKKKKYDGVYKLKMWIGEDARKLPLKIVADTEYGDLEIELEKVIVGKHFPFKT